MSELSPNREDLLEDSQATLREIAGILGELWDHQGPDPRDGPSSHVVDDFTGIEGPIRISEILHDVQKRLDHLAGDLESKGICME